jgi:hypothetical protein
MPPALMTTETTTPETAAPTSPTVYWHRSSPEGAEAILRDGFRDGEGPYLTAESHRGVWISDRPLDPNDGTRAGPLLRVTLASRSTSTSGSRRTTKASATLTRATGSGCCRRPC